MVLTVLSGCIGSGVQTKITYVKPEGWAESNFFGSIFYSDPKDHDNLIQFLPETDVAENYNLDDLTALSKQERGNCDNFQIASTNARNINGLQAFEFIELCKDKADGISYKIKTIRILKNSELAVFNLYSKEADFERNEPIFDKVIQSVNWA